VRGTSLLGKLVGITNTRVVGVEVENGALLVYVRPTWTLPRCGLCGNRCRGGSVATEARRWRHLDLAGFVQFLCYDIRRVYCRTCGAGVERVPWASNPKAWFTEDFDDEVAFMAQRCDKTAVQIKMRIAWRTVGSCIERVLQRRRPADPLEDLAVIGVDEISYRKHHHYLTLVADHVEGKIVWGKAGKDAETLKAFFDDLGEDRTKEILAVSIDMSAAYLSAIRERAPGAQVVFDRFHVQGLASKALDETRRELWRELRRTGSDGSRALKHSRWALLKRPMNVTEAEEAKLAEIQRDNRSLYRGYLLNAELRDILDRRQPNVVRALLLGWVSWALRSRLPAFVRTAKTIREYLDEIVAYVRWRLTNGLIEGLNNKARLLTRRAYGFHSAEAALAMILLCCSGLDLPPVHKQLAV
jgi:transposase